MCVCGGVGVGRGAEASFTIADAHAIYLGPRGRAAKYRAALVVTFELEIPEQRARSPPRPIRIWPQASRLGMREKALRPCRLQSGHRPSPGPRCGWGGARCGRTTPRATFRSPLPRSHGRAFRSRECRAERTTRRSGGGAEGSGSAPRGKGGRTQPPREPAGQPVSGRGGRASGRARRAPQRPLRGGGGSWFRLRAQRWWRRRDRPGCNRRPSGSGWSGSGGRARREATPQGSGGSGASGGAGDAAAAAAAAARRTRGHAPPPPPPGRAGCRAPRLGGSRRRRRHRYRRRRRRRGD